MVARIIAALALTSLVACGGGDEDPCTTASAAGPFTDANGIARVTVHSPGAAVDAAARATITGLKDGAEVFLKLSHDGHPVAEETVRLNAGETRTVVLTHTFAELDGDVYFGTLAINDHGDMRSAVTGVVVQACHVMP